jgi:hypothetical protein
VNSTLSVSIYGCRINETTVRRIGIEKRAEEEEGDEKSWVWGERRD